MYVTNKRWSLFKTSDSIQDDILSARRDTDPLTSSFFFLLASLKRCAEWKRTSGAGQSGDSTMHDAELAASRLYSWMYLGIVWVERAAGAERDNWTHNI